MIALFTTLCCAMIVIIVIPAIVTDSFLNVFLSLVGVALLVALIIVIISISEKQTSIKYLNNQPVYEKNYVVNDKDEKVDSVYVKIKTK